MLPTSHFAPINVLHADMSSSDLPRNTDTLASAFEEFSAAAGRLEKSYQELQNEVTQLRAILAERNQALRASRTEIAQTKLALRQIVDALPCGVLVLHRDKRLALINPEARRLLNMADKKVESFADTPLWGHAALQAAMDSGNVDDAEHEVCIPALTPPRWLAVRSRQLFRASANGTTQPGGTAATQPQTILILRDATSQKKLESDREQARNVMALAEMSAVLAHEIRNPLASLELFAGLIGKESTGTAEYVSQLRAGIRRLSATVNNVLDMYGNGLLQLTPLVLGDVLSRAVEFIRPLAEQKQIALSFTDRTEDLAIAGDENAIQQLVANLAVNAFRHTESGGSLKIIASTVRLESGEWSRVEFCDSGCGILPDLLPRLFEVGFSGSGQTPGLGLAVCRQIVEQHRGSIRVRSRHGKGSTFIVELPAL